MYASSYDLVIVTTAVLFHGAGGSVVQIEVLLLAVVVDLFEAGPSHINVEALSSVKTVFLIIATLSQHIRFCCVCCILLLANQK